MQVRAVAEAVGVTDAAVHHHFGSRERLLEDLLRHGGRRLRSQVQDVARCFADRTPDLGRLVDSLAEIYAATGYAELALGLHLSGWRNRGSGLLRPIVDALHAVRCVRADEARQPRPSLEDTQLAVSALHQALATDPIFGAEFRRSAGLVVGRATGARRQRSWWLTTLAKALSLDSRSREHRS